ncbi:MAG: cupin domain-containing protein [Bacteroidales bacterium]|nr:cupin domain-containing protein [Bacteroidales bacterium]
MIIDFSSMEETHVEGFKGGEGLMHSRGMYDGHNRMMLNRLEPGATGGYHEHTGNCEMIYVLSGTLDFVQDGSLERCSAGSLHYCPKGHAHGFANNGAEEALFLAIVSEQC